MLLFPIKALASARVSTVTEEISSLLVSDSVSLVALFNANTATTAVVFETACIADVPVLFSKYLFSNRIRAVLFRPFHVSEWVFVALNKLFLLETFDLNVIGMCLWFLDPHYAFSLVLYLLRQCFGKLNLLQVFPLLDFFSVLLSEIVNLLGSVLLVLYVLGHGELAHEVENLEFG